MSEQEEIQEENEEALDPMDALKGQLAECEEKYVRLMAESENTRKRLLKERQELTQYAVDDVLTEFLHPLDNLENALKFADQMSDEVKNWATGFQMIATQFKQVLSDHGVEPFESKGKHFDPHLHEALEMVETTEHPPGTIIEECILGYKKGEKAIRVARVKVAKAPEEKLEEKEGENNE